MSPMRSSIAEMLICRTANGRLRRSAYSSLKMRFVESHTSAGRQFGRLQRIRGTLSKAGTSSNDPYDMRS